jgi:hypothetical protein
LTGFSEHDSEFSRKVEKPVEQSGESRLYRLYYLQEVG